MIFRLFAMSQQKLTHGDDMEGKEGWVVVEALPDEAVVKETNERKVTTHDEVEDILETEEVQHYGDVSNDVSSTLSNYPKFNSI